jgi:hypothetical protein
MKNYISLLLLLLSLSFAQNKAATRVYIVSMKKITNDPKEKDPYLLKRN